MSSTKKINKDNRDQNFHALKTKKDDFCMFIGPGIIVIVEE